jgi:hypothetical protein
MCISVQRHSLLEALRYAATAYASTNTYSPHVIRPEEAMDNIVIVKAFDAFSLLRSLQGLADAGASDPTVGGFIALLCLH